RGWKKRAWAPRMAVFSPVPNAALFNGSTGHARPRHFAVAGLFRPRGADQIAGAGAATERASAFLSPRHAGQREKLFRRTDKFRRIGLGFGQDGLSLSKDPSGDGQAMAFHAGHAVVDLGRYSRRRYAAAAILPDQSLSRHGAHGPAPGPG